MALSLEDLKVFRAVAAAGSFGRAAAELHLSQPTVSERMARLERDLSAPLFLRSASGTRLTAAGERLLPYAQRCLALAEQAITAVHADDPRPGVRVAMHATFAPLVMPRVLDALAPLAISVSCTDAHSEDVVRLLAAGAADIGLVTPCSHPTTITVEPFLADPVICVVSPRHPLAGRAWLQVRDLAGGAVACNPWGEGADPFLRMLRAASIPSAQLHLVSPAETVANLARRASHVGVLTRSTVAHDVDSGELVELPVVDLPPWEITLDLAYRIADADTDAVRALRCVSGSRARTEPGPGRGRSSFPRPRMPPAERDRLRN